MADRIQQRRDTAARWAQYNPVLLEGEVGYVTDNPNQYKIGDGIHAWNDLPLRGYTGTIVQGTGSDENTVMSQKATTEKLAELNNKVSSVGYVVCQTNASIAAKAVTVDGITEITDNLRLLVQMNFANTSTGTVTLNINNLGAKTLYYNGATVSAVNTWDTGEIVEIYFVSDTFQCFNAKGSITPMQSLYQTFEGIKGQIDLVFNASIEIPENACLIIETKLEDSEFIPESQILLATILGRYLDYMTTGFISSRLNTGINLNCHKKSDKMSIIVANRDKVYDENNAIFWSDQTKTSFPKYQFVELNNLSVNYKGHSNVVLGDIIVLKRKLELFEIPIAYKNHRAFLSEAIIFFPKEKYNNKYAIEVCSGSKVFFKNSGQIV